MIRHLVRTLVRSAALGKTLRSHFGVPPEQLVTASRLFPITSRVDLQSALDGWMAAQGNARLIGIHAQEYHGTLRFAHLFGGPLPAEAGPLQHDEVDTGDDAPRRCIRNGLWLARRGGVPIGVLVSQAVRFGCHEALHLEVAVPAGEPAAAVSEAFLRDIELRVAAGRAYRGRVISLEQSDDYRGRIAAVKVHRLRRVERDEVILPAKTLELLDRNVAGFVAARQSIKALHFQAKKGLLFHGPPGTGKTHTIHYLATQLPEHTTVLVTAEQVALIGEYFRLARFLQPAMMVVEDVDLIARERENLNHPAQEVLLNKLLNEMDGLREDADVLFILTTNRPDHLEPALAARPGRIDQAIEFPLPDEAGREKLVALYSRGLRVPGDVATSIVRRTQGASPAFIKELMRRSAQFQIEQDRGSVLAQPAVDAAIDEMVVAGGALNVKLLGGSSEVGRVQSE